MSNPVILTGIRANNDLHIGHYFGAMLPLIDMASRHADEYTINLFIPDLHSFTTPIDYDQLYGGIMNNARIYVAAGLPIEYDSVNLYRQSAISAHSELTVLLNNFTGFGEMERMTQFKDKASKLSNDRISVGLFDYPVLMASDVLLYDAMYVPVGDDQTQHLEFIRDIAERINNRFGELFTIPEPVAKQHQFFGKDQGLRIMDLQDPSKKMSKSDETGKGVIFLGDDPGVSVKKVMSATTDSLANIAYDRANQPGITNLIDILALLRNVPTAIIVDEFGGSERYGDFKRVVADEIKTFVINFQAKLANVDNKTILDKFESSEAVMRERANATLLRVQQAVGLRPKGA